MVTLALRPEAISLEASPARNSKVEVIVQDVHFLGSVIRTRVMLGGNQLSFDSFNSPAVRPPQHGDKITVHFSAQDLLVLGK
jgi:putative spermidine/putrescine transport system ATP-binding protein